MRTITINTSPEDAAAIDRVAGLVPLATRHAVGRAALRLGLSLMIEDDDLAVERLVAQHRKADTNN